MNLIQIMLAEGNDISKTTSGTRILAEIVIFSALSAALYTLRPFSLPYGGSITIGSMVPVLWLSLRRGVRVGFIASAIFGVIALLIDIMLLPYSPIAHPVQVLFEYPVAFGMLGIVGWFRNPPSSLRAIYAQIDRIKRRLRDKIRLPQEEIDEFSELEKKVGALEKELMSALALVGVGITIFIRFLIHFFAGIIFWSATVPPGWGVAAWSAVYNGSFLTGEFIMSAFLVYLLVRKGTLKIFA